MQACHAAAATLTVAEAVERMDARRVPFGLVVAPADLPDDPHARAIGLFEESTHPVAGRLRQPRHPARFEGTPATLGGPSPSLGEHTDEILEELGMGDRIQELRDVGAVA
jgi:crotonobetainyl-CoA:carnitine CoA-transferase CaiB-like acyl-CoA transferase